MKTFIGLVVLMSLSACDSGTWVDAVSLDCKNGSLVGSPTGNNKDIARGFCAVSGKAFTGEFQCKGNDVLVKCK